MAFLQETFRSTILLLTSLFVLAFAANTQAQCAFDNLEWEVQDCVDGTFYVSFSFNNPTPSEDGFVVFKDFPEGYFTSHLFYGESSYTIGPFAGEGSTTYQFTLYDYGTNNCEGNISVGTVACEPSDECVLFASAQQSDCFGGGQFQWMLFVNPINNGIDEGYTVYNTLNEQVYFSETYANNENYAFIEAQSNGVGETVIFTVVDNANPACQRSFSAVDLGCSLCEIDITSAIVIDCNADGDYFVELSVASTNSNTGQFTVGASYNFDVQWGPFDYGQESYTIGPIIAAGDENFIFVNDVDTEAEACYDNFYFGEIECPVNCVLDIVSVTPSICIDGQFYVNIEIIAENGNSDAFSLVIGNEMFDLPYGQELYNVGPINQNNNGIYQIGVFDPLDDSCNDGFEFILECEDVNSCVLDITSVTAGPCDDGDFYIDVAISAENTTSDVFNLVVGNQMFDGIPFNEPGTYSFAPINSNNTGIYQVAIYDPADDSCNDSFEIEVECEEVVNTCNLDIISVTTTECTTGEFFAELTINSESTSTDVFNILIGVDVFSGQVYGQDTYTVGPISENSSGSYIASVNDPADDSCYDSFTFEVECTPICNLFPSNFAPINCEGNQVYFIGSIEAEDVGNEGFTVLLNGENYGAYDYVPTTNYEFGPFPYLVGEDYNFEFLDNDSDGACTGAYTYPAFDIENCGNYCFVNLNALEVSECNADNQYFLSFEVSTNASSPSTSFMAIVGSTGEEFGPFNYGQDVYMAGPFTPDGTTGDFLYVQDASGVAGCGAHELLFNAPDCGLNFDCAIEITDLDVGECDANGQYMVNFQVNSENPASASFRVYINDDSWSYQFTYAGSDVYSIGPFDSNISVINLLIHDTLDEQCDDFVSFATPDCNQVECGFDNLSLDYQGCNEETGTAFLVNFTPVGTGNTSFDVTANGEFLSTHLYADMPVTINIPAQPGNFAVLNFCDNTNPNCCTETFADVVNCDETGDCGLFMNGAQFTDCVDGSFNIFVPTINMDGVLSETFNAYINDELIGNFSYDQEDWLFGPVTLDGETPLILTIIDSENETCPASLNFGTPNPCENTPECTIDIPVFELYECNDQGQIYVDFEVTGLADGDQFTAFGNGQQYGTFTYGETFYTVGPFDGDGSTYELIISSLTQDDCTTFIGFDAPNCETDDCQINIPLVEVGACNADGMFFVDFEMLPIDGDGTVEITGNGQNYGLFDYNLPLYTVGPFDGTETATYELIVTDTENPDCVQILTFASANCNAEDCNMSLTFDEYANCFGDNQFYVIVSVTNGNVDEGSFTFVGNGETYGTEEYGAGSYAVGPFLGNGDVTYELIAIDNTDESCSVELTFLGQDCFEEPECDIEITFIENYECNNAAEFDFDFGVTGLEAGDQFYAQITGQEEVLFTFGEDSYTHGSVLGDGANYGLTVYPVGQVECSVSVEIEAQNCLDNFPCSFEAISTQFEECAPDGAHFYTLDFEPFNVTGNLFNYTVNGNTNLYAYDALPLEVIIFPTDEEIAIITICDNEDAECCQEIVLELPECETEECSMEVEEYELTECDEIGNFYVNFSLNVANPISNSFFAFHNGTTYGPFEYGQETYQIGPLDGFETAVYEIIIYDSEDESCNTEIVFDSANCEGNEDCSLEIPEFQIIDCDPDNQFYVQFAVIANNPDAATFVATGNGENYGTFSYEDGSYIVGPFDGNLDPIWEIIVTDTENPDCSTFITFVGSGCDGEECNLDNVGAIELSPCNEEGQFYVDILMLTGSGGTGSFTVVGNGENYGTFEYGEDFYTVGPFNGDGESVYELIAVDDANDECTYVTEFVAADCENASVCNLEVLEYFSTECNNEGQYFVNIYLTETSFGSTFQVFSGIEAYGPFEYGEEEYTVGPFDTGSDDFNLELFDTGFDQCFDNILVDAVDCPISDCFIENLEVVTGECNGENTYSVIINFVYNDIGGEFFNLIYQNEIIGTYETENLPITIENFAGNAEVETLTVCMTDIEDCCVSIDFLTPQCEGLVTWPGDGNFDGITNNMDILNMGIAYGFEGPERVIDNIGWDAQDAFTWEWNFASGVNYVHADADGNGEINMLDADVVEVNYDLTHDEVTPFVELEPTDSSPALFVDMPDPFELQQGMEFSAPVIFGLEALPVENVYGLAFTLRYDPEIIDPSSILLQYPISWLGFPQTNLMTFDYHDIDAGEIDVAITKIDQNNVSGWGEILSFIGIIDNIAGKAEIFIEIDNVTAILSNEERFAVNTPTEITTITSTENVNELQGFELFPNPTNDIVQVKNETGLILQNIQISDLNGKVLRTVKGEESFDLSDLPSGVYMAQVVFAGKTVYRKIVRM